MQGGRWPTQLLRSAVGKASPVMQRRGCQARLLAFLAFAAYALLAAAQPPLVPTESRARPPPSHLYIELAALAPVERSLLCPVRRWSLRPAGSTRTRACRKTVRAPQAG